MILEVGGKKIIVVITKRMNQKSLYCSLYHQVSKTDYQNFINSLKKQKNRKYSDETIGKYGAEIKEFEEEMRLLKEIEKNGNYDLRAICNKRIK